MTENELSAERQARKQQYQRDYYINKTKKRRLQNNRHRRRYRRRDPDSPMIVFHLSMKKEEHALAKQVADGEGISMASVIMRAFHRDMENRVPNKDDLDDTSP